jgi:hypothetical protein
MEKSFKFSIIDNRTRPYWRTVSSMFVLVIGPILLGVFARSDALQWGGFVFGLLSLVGLAQRISGDVKAYTINEARALLDRLEREGGAA